VLHLKRPGDMLRGKMALLYVTGHHDTPGTVEKPRDYDLIQRAGATAAKAVQTENLPTLAEAVSLSYQAQLGEGMPPLPDAAESIAKKYCGGGWGGYAVYLFAEDSARQAFLSANSAARLVEPYIHEERVG